MPMHKMPGGHMMSDKKMNRMMSDKKKITKKKISSSDGYIKR